tara:strand:+ start:4493 stop:4621 length:129 start_codon:yes stop_codon:yes gene_type:complete
MNRWLATLSVLMAIAEANFSTLLIANATERRAQLKNRDKKIT